MPENPEIIFCPADTWVLVAAAVSGGTITKINNLPEVYLQTYRQQDQVAPIGDADAAVLFSGGLCTSISNNTPIDVYVKSRGRDGLIRVDL